MILHVPLLAAAIVIATSQSGNLQPASVDDRFVKILTSVPLDYPPIAATARMQGPVVVAVTWDHGGNVTDASALSGNPIIKEAAVANARRWTFAPSEQRRAVLVYDFQILDSCAVTGQPPPFNVRQTIATISACTPIVQPQR